MSFDEIMNETSKLKEFIKTPPYFTFTFFKHGRPIETVFADNDGEAVSKLRSMGYNLEYFDKYVRFNRTNKVYELFKTN